MLVEMRGHGHGHTTATASHTGRHGHRKRHGSVAHCASGSVAHSLAGCAISWIAGSLDRVCACVASCVAGCVSGSADWVLGGHGYGRTSGVLTAWGKKGTRIDENHEFVNRLVHLNGSLKSKATNET